MAKTIPDEAVYRFEVTAFGREAKTFDTKSEANEWAENQAAASPGLTFIVYETCNQTPRKLPLIACFMLDPHSWCAQPDESLLQIFDLCSDYCATDRIAGHAAEGEELFVAREQSYEKKG